MRDQARDEEAAQSGRAFGASLVLHGGAGGARRSRSKAEAREGLAVIENRYLQ